MRKGKGAGSQLPLLDARKGCKRKNSNSWNTLGFIQACLPTKAGFTIKTFLAGGQAVPFPFHSALLMVRRFPRMMGNDDTEDTCTDWL